MMSLTTVLYLGLAAYGILGALIVLVARYKTKKMEREA